LSKHDLYDDKAQVLNGYLSMDMFQRLSIILRVSSQPSFEIINQSQFKLVIYLSIQKLDSIVLVAIDQ